MEYKLSDDLSKGQIDQIFNDMLLDKIAEEYPEIHLHGTLFHINQLLYKASMENFLILKPVNLSCIITPVDSKIEMTKEAALKLLS